MASWMVHLRIADKLLDAIPGLSPVEFIVGNVAPDSGVPNENWTAYSPSSQVSHFRNGGSLDAGKCIDIPKYISKYFTVEMQAGYNAKFYSFYLGYLAHLLTDILWEQKIYLPSIQKYPEAFASDKMTLIWKLKNDWYDLDYLYLRNHPGFRAFRVYLGAVGFVNEFMEEFSADAFDNRREYITSFYLQSRDGLDREYPYLTEKEMDAFVEASVAEIIEQLNIYQAQPV